ncbi:AAA family ATPase [Tissierella pigra]|uniref:ATP-dependent nuclease n=1 Tax=Tissierella pigra TaxID=2607614 RepID=UPI0012B2786F|nr:AAA family ATPase [Tissierella pigra]MBU5426990.1 AAA family ATPase [Tissierella pigra]
MRIKRISINNYRNLDGICINFHPINNFIVGENNLGKSNLLDLFNILYNFNSFRVEDFANIDEPIRIEMTLSLFETEKGLFNDLFDPEESDNINIIAVQDTVDSIIIFKHLETDTIISNSLIKCVNYINYNSLRLPNTELNFDRNRGVGKFLGHLISKYLDSQETSDIDFIKTEELDGLLDYINRNLIKIKSFNDFSIHANLDKDIKNLLSKVVVLADSNNFDLKDVGSGIQFLSMITLTIFEKILNMNKTRLEKSVMQNEDGENCIPIILGLDEPEIHLHPHMQRSLIKNLIRIIENKDSNFSDLLNTIFDIDNVMGQIIATTHSPNILTNDYKKIIRFYEGSGHKLNVKSGIDIRMEAEIEKHLLAQFAYIKEAFFARSVIIVEGDSEFSSIPIFAEKLEIDFDYLGISIIKASGANSVIPIKDLLESFGIKSIGIIDQDKYKESYRAIDNIYHTLGKDFEEDIVNTLIDKGKIEVLREIVCEYDVMGSERTLEENALNKRIKKYNLDIPDVMCPYKIADAEINDKDMAKLIYLTWLDINKTIILGRIIGYSLEKEDIPTVYIDAIKKAKELLENVE